MKLLDSLMIPNDKGVESNLIHKDSIGLSPEQTVVHGTRHGVAAVNLHHIATPLFGRLGQFLDGAGHVSRAAVVDLDAVGRVDRQSVGDDCGEHVEGDRFEVTVVIVDVEESYREIAVFGLSRGSGWEEEECYGHGR